jgi:di/tricarboxylate transporter
VTLLIAPVALRIALDLGCSPLPFLFGVATAAAMCFASPFSTPSNALVMSTGRYTFFDYLKIGLPLQALMGVFMVLVLPLLFPF